jgi:hypothetical protein
MKKPIPIFLLTFLCSCQITSQQKAEQMVKNYLDTTLDNPKGYESVNFGKLLFLKDTVASFQGGKPDTIKLKELCEIQHKYRGTNKFGATITKTEYFQIDFKNNSVYCCFFEPQNHY